MKAPGGKGTKLCGITWDHPRGYLPLDAASKRYKEQRNVRVLWERRSLKDFGDMPVKLLEEKYDLLVIDHPHIAAAVSEGCLLKLDDLLQEGDLALFASQSVGCSYESYHYTGHQWALPIDAACQVAACRPDLLEHKIPQTWEEVFSLAADLRPLKKFIGIALCPTDCACTFLTLSAQCRDAPEERKKELVDFNSGINILTGMLRLKRTSHPACSDWNPIKLYDYMVAHDDLCYSPLGFGYVNYATGGDHTLQYTGIPGGSGSLLGGAGIAISSTCKNREAAAAYIRWICDPGYQKTKYLLEGGQPAQLDAWTDLPANTYAADFFSGTLPTMQQAYMRPRMVRWPLFQEYLGEVIHEFLTHEKRPETTMAEINRAYQNMLYK